MTHNCNGATLASRFPWAIVRKLPNMQRITVAGAIAAMPKGI